MQGVTTTHPDYDNNIDIWTKIRDTIKGEEAIKEKKYTYLPAFVPADEDRYTQYITRAYFMGVTGRTRDALVGMVFRKPPVYDMPDTMLDIIENIDGAGQSLEQIAKEACGDLISIGRYIFLVDYPMTDEGVRTLSDEKKLSLQPTIICYPAESLINWKTITVGGKTLLSLAVLKETRDTSSNEFEHETDYQYRVLRLVDGFYTQAVYNGNDEPIIEEFQVLAGGAPLDHIPLHIAGSQNNKPTVDKAPLHDMAILNIAHYQTTADHRENLYIHGQLTLGISTDLDWETFKAANPSGVMVGARKGHFLGNNGAFHSVTAPESSILSKELTDLENKMIMIGARLIQRGGQTETAEAARINASAEASTLDNIVSNLSEALEAALEDCARFMKLDPEKVFFALNKEFWEGSIDYNTAMAVIQLGDASIVAKSDQRRMLRTGKIGIEEGRTDEEIDAEIGEQGI